MVDHPQDDEPRPPLTTGWPFGISPEMAQSAVEDRAVRDQLLQALHARLLSLARKLLNRYDHDSRLGEAEDLVQGFLADKFLPDAKLRMMLGPFINGKMPLWPRLSHSLKNFAKSKLRRKDHERHVLVGSSEEDGEHNPVAPPEPERPHSVDIQERLRRQTEATIAALSDKPSMLAAVLLEARVELAKQITKSFLEQPLEASTICDLVVELTPWPDSIATQVILDDRSLRDLWRRLREDNNDQVAQADASDLAALLGVGRETYYQWCFRGRRKVAGTCGETRREAGT